MMTRVSAFNALALIALLLAQTSLASQAETVVVKPGSMNGWTAAVQTGTANKAPVAEFVDGIGTPPLGSGSYHLHTYYSDTNPLSKIYMGTNNHSGVALFEITSLRYWTYLDSRNYSTETSNNGQPPMIELNCISGTQQRLFTFKPYGAAGQTNVALDTWQSWDLMDPAGRWELLQTGSADYFGNWSWVLGRYASLRLDAPLVGDYTSGSAGYIVVDGVAKLSNQTGTSISIKIGSGKATDSKRGAWWKEGSGIDGYADMLTIGINGGETTYDFENGPLPVVIIRSRDADNAAIIDKAKLNFRFTVYGVVDDEIDGNLFFVNDGSAGSIKVMAPGHFVWPGIYVKATGILDNSQSPKVLNSSYDQVELLSP